MKQEAYVEAVDIYHDGFELFGIAPFASAKLQVTVFVKPLLLLTDRHVVEDVHLRRNLTMVRNQLQFADVDDAVKLECDFLRVGAKSFGLPPL